MTKLRFSSSFAAMLLAALSVSFSLETIAETDAATSAALDTALAGSHRSERNKARDRFRHPKETLTFFGLRRDMTVVEIWPGGGWYTEVLAPVLKGTGKLYAAQYGSKSTSRRRSNATAAPAAATCRRSPGSRRWRRSRNARR